MNHRGGDITTDRDVDACEFARSNAVRRRVVTDLLSSFTAWIALLAFTTSLSPAVIIVVGASVAFATVGLTWAHRGYSRGTGIGRVLEHRQLLRAGLSAGALILVIDQLADLDIGIAAVVGATLIAALSQQAGRALVDHHESKLRRSGMVLDRVLIVADEHESDDVVDLLAEQRDSGWLIVGISGVSRPAPTSLAQPHTAAVHDLARQVERLRATVVVVTGSVLRDESYRTQLLAIRRSGVDVHVHAGLRGLDCRDVRAAPLGSATVLCLDQPRLLGCQRFAKRSLDLVVATGVLIVAVPVLALTALAVKIEDGGPILFRQRRVGREGVTFWMPKFRSMQIDAEDRVEELQHLNERDGGPLFKIDADPRVTRTGRIIRALSIDELPQLVSVIRGDMSLIGPRPALPAEVAQFDARLASRHDVRPGLTGLWQVEARDDESFDAYRRLDLFYVENWTLLLDFTILVHTVPAVVKRGLNAVRNRTSTATIHAPFVQPEILTTSESGRTTELMVS